MPFYASFRIVFISILHHSLCYFMCISLNNVNIMSFVRIPVLLMFWCHFLVIQVERYFGSNFDCVWWIIGAKLELGTYKGCWGMIGSCLNQGKMDISREKPQIRSCFLKKLIVWSLRGLVALFWSFRKKKQKFDHFWSQNMIVLIVRSSKIP